MNISNELLAAYAEGNVSDEERKIIREYLIQNPDELESVMIMQDRDYELSVQNDFASELNSHTMSKDRNATPDLCYSAAAFVPDFGVSKMSNHIQDRQSQNFFFAIDQLIDELEDD